MSILTGSKIIEEIKNGNIVIDPFDESHINPNSYNLRIAPTLKVYTGNPAILDRLRRGQIKTANFINAFDLKTKFGNAAILDFHSRNNTREINITSGGFLLEPGELYLGRTLERTFTDKYVPIINGRSSVGRLGVSVHITAGFGDVGFDGTWTLEITAEKPIVIYPNDELCQVYFESVEGETDIQYKGRYQHQVDVEASKFNEKKYIYVGDIGFVNGKFDEFGKPLDEETAKLMEANKINDYEFDYEKSVLENTKLDKEEESKDEDSSSNGSNIDNNNSIIRREVKEQKVIAVDDAEDPDFKRLKEPIILDNDGNEVKPTEYQEIVTAEEKPKKTTTRKKSTSTTKKSTTSKSTKSSKPKEEVKTDEE